MNFISCQILHRHSTPQRIGDGIHRHRASGLKRVARNSDGPGTFSDPQVMRAIAHFHGPDRVNQAAKKSRAVAGQAVSGDPDIVRARRNRHANQTVAGDGVFRNRELACAHAQYAVTVVVLNPAILHHHTADVRVDLQSAALVAGYRAVTESDIPRRPLPLRLDVDARLGFGPMGMAEGGMDHVDAANRTDGKPLAPIVGGDHMVKRHIGRNDHTGATAEPANPDAVTPAVGDMRAGDTDVVRRLNADAIAPFTRGATMPDAFTDDSTANDLDVFCTPDLDHPRSLAVVCNGAERSGGRYFQAHVGAQFDRAFRVDH